MTEIKCPFVVAVYLDTLKTLLKHTDISKISLVQEPISELESYCKKMIANEAAKPELRVEDDFGHSILRLKMIRFVIQVNTTYRKKEGIYLELVEMFLKRLFANAKLYEIDDPEPLRFVLEKLEKHLKKISVLPNDVEQKIQKELIACLAQGASLYLFSLNYLLILSPLSIIQDYRIHVVRLTHSGHSERNRLATSTRHQAN